MLFGSGLFLSYAVLYDAFRKTSNFKIRFREKKIFDICLSTLMTYMIIYIYERVEVMGSENIQISIRKLYKGIEKVTFQFEDWSAAIFFRDFVLSVIKAIQKRLSW